MAERFDRSVRDGRLELSGAAQAALEQALPPRAAISERHVAATDAAGSIIAAHPARGTLSRPALQEILARARMQTMASSRAGAIETTLADGTSVQTTMRPLALPFGRLAVVEPRAAALAAWRADTVLTITLFTTTGFVLLILGFAFHWQAMRAREADLIYDTVRCRIDTALNRGRCGLWDWDLAHGRIFWSHSMFDILGLPARGDLLTFGEVSALVHPEDAKLYELAAQVADAETTTIDRAFRMRHARGDWVWLRARCELVQQPGGPGTHLIGIAVDITEQKNLAERTAAADVRLRDAIESISEAFVVWDADNRRSRGGRQADCSHADDERNAPERERAHLRGPARGRALAPYQRTAHQRRRIRLRGHRYYGAQAQ